MGISIEDLEVILHPMAEEGKEAIGSMGDDTLSCAIRYRPLNHFFCDKILVKLNLPLIS